MTSFSLIEWAADGAVQSADGTRRYNVDRRSTRGESKSAELTAASRSAKSRCDRRRRRRWRHSFDQTVRVSDVSVDRCVSATDRALCRRAPKSRRLAAAKALTGGGERIFKRRREAAARAPRERQASRSHGDNQPVGGSRVRLGMRSTDSCVSGASGEVRWRSFSDKRG
jgi:hypothetical protein